MRAKIKHKRAMIKYWSDPANEFICRFAMHKNVLKISAPTFYKYFTPEEITEIENEAANERRKKYARERSKVIDAMYKEGKSGNVSAAKEFLDRTEGKITDKIDVTNSYPDIINIVLKKAEEK